MGIILLSELPTYEGFLPALPATIMRILGVNPPSFIPEPISPIVDKFGGKGGGSPRSAQATLDNEPVDIISELSF